MLESFLIIVGAVTLIVIWLWCILSSLLACKFGLRSNKRGDFVSGDHKCHLCKKKYKYTWALSYWIHSYIHFFPLSHCGKLAKKHDPKYGWLYWITRGKYK